MRDEDRALTEEGQEKMKRGREGAATDGPGIDLLFSSPLVRARQTAEIVAAELMLRWF